MITHQTQAFLNLASLCCTAILLGTGCSSSPIVVQVTHGPIQSCTAKRAGHLLLKPFNDARPFANKSMIGATPTANYLDPRLGFNPVLIKEGENLAELLTGYFAEALQSAGYQVSIQPLAGQLPGEPFDGLVTGDIRMFWLAAAWKTRLTVVVQLCLRDKDGGVLWEKEIRGEHAKFIGLYNGPEFEGVIQKALDTTLAQAAREFASDDFQQMVKGGK